MSEFYQDGANFVVSITKPTSQGGLGQGNLQISRVVKGVADPSTPWVPAPDDVVQTEQTQGVVSGVETKLIGTAADSGAVILASDRMAVCSVPAIRPVAGDTLVVDGKPINIISVKPIPAAGIACAMKYVIRG